MSLLLIAPDRDISPLKEAALQEDPNLDIEIWPKVSSNEQVQFAVCWNQPSNVLNKYPNLKTISSLGAGVEHIMTDDTLPDDVAICRVVSPTLVQQVREYVLNAVLNYQRHTLDYVYQGQRGEWKPFPYRAPQECAVGIMGLGSLGRPTALLLSGLGYKVSGWSGSPKSIENVQAFSGEQEFDKFLQETQILVCMLPLTAKTRGILDLDTFKTLQHPAYLINVGRGEHLVEEDLIYALDKEWLEGACLDVFPEEPLPERHAFWNRPNIMITPHVASLIPTDEAAKQIVENYKRTLSGMDLIQKVDRKKGY